MDVLVCDMKSNCQIDQKEPSNGPRVLFLLEEVCLFTGLECRGLLDTGEGSGAWDVCVAQAECEVLGVC